MYAIQFLFHHILKLLSLLLLCHLIQIPYLTHIFVLDGINSSVKEAHIINHSLGECIHELVKFRKTYTHILSGMHGALYFGQTHLG